MGDLINKLKPKTVKWPFQRVDISRAHVGGLTGISCDFSRMRMDGSIGDLGVAADMKRIEARAIDMEDRTIYDEVVRTACEAGIDTLYLMDRQFVIDALREKLERDYYGKC